MPQVPFPYFYHTPKVHQTTGRTENSHASPANIRERPNVCDESKIVAITSELSPINFSARTECHYGQEHRRNRTHSTVSQDMAIDDVNVEIDWMELKKPVGGSLKRNPNIQCIPKNVIRNLISLLINLISFLKLIFKHREKLESIAQLTCK